MTPCAPDARRRACLGLPLALALGSGCGEQVSLPPSAWVGAPPERGHRLRHADTPPVADGPLRRCSVAIVGGGVAGLAAARALRRAGIDDIALFELEDEAGGNARGHRLGGMACPLGAHYLPLPGAQAHEVSEWLHELGLLQHRLGRTVADERHLCHSPQERLWLEGDWVDGLLPPAEPGSAREAQYRRYGQRIAELARTLGFAIPSHRAGWTAGHAALDALPFSSWLDAEGFSDPALRWALDYACRDDYGADSRAVSAWAGVHYHASRHGFAAPGEAEEAEPVFTWPEGNAWLVRHLAAPLGERLQAGRLVRRVEAQRHQVMLEVAGTEGNAAQRWQAQQVVMALPLHVAVRVVANPPSALRTAAAQVIHAPWLVANLELDAALTDKPGAPPSWDNVLHGPGVAPASLGYVDAMHQSLRPVRGPTVLSAYWALGEADATALQATRRTLLSPDPAAWTQRVMAELARAHPDLPRKTVRVALARYGHAMAVPTPLTRGHPALQALRDSPAAARLHYAHADLAGYSIFEEAFTLGDAAGRAAAAALHGRA